MIGASIYGFVDYKQSSNKKEFTNMYEEEKVKEPELANDKKVEDPATKKEGTTLTEKKEIIKMEPVKKIVSKRKTAAKKNKYFNRKMFSRGALDERYIEPKKVEEVKTDTKKTEEKGQ
jgi:hypothetical protein